ncbi:MAG: serine protein kinase RIO [Candidatus Wallbacteria bacterium]|nr:serine protein kinase RIO [Candidatus Wallbacteria bacterium]
MQKHTDLPVLENLQDSGVIDEVYYRIKSGKEATVYCCRTGPVYGSQTASVKVYSPVKVRSFKRAGVYSHGRVVLDKREGRAIANKSDFGRDAQLGQWIGQEFEAMVRLFDAGADIPMPIRCESRAMVMEHIGDTETPAPHIRDVELDRNEARCLYEKVMGNIELFLSANCVHGDLSAYNILYWEGQVKIIDFPQCVDPRFNCEALAILERDIANVHAYFRRYGITDNVPARARQMWHRFVNARM